MNAITTPLSPDLLTLQGESFPKRIVLKSPVPEAPYASAPIASGGGAVQPSTSNSQPTTETKALGFLTSANTLIAAEYGLWCIQCASQQEAFEILSVAFNEKEG